MSENYELKLQSDSESEGEYVESVVTTTGDTSESWLSAPTLYSDSDVSIKVYDFTQPPAKFICLVSNMGYKFIIKRKYTRTSCYLSLCLSKSNTIYLPFEPEVIQLVCNYLTYRWWTFNSPGVYSPFLVPADVAVQAAKVGTLLGI